MDPPLLLIGIDLGPHMVLRIPYPTNTTTNSSAQHGEAVRPLSTSTPSALQQGPNIGVSRETFISSTRRLATLIQFDTGGPSSGFIWSGWGHASSEGRHIACRARRVVDELEE